MSGRSTEFESAFRANHDFVWRCLRSFGVPVSSVDDAVQEVFMVMHRRLPEFDHRVPVRGWLYGIARKVAMAQRRKMSRTVELTARADSDRPLQDESLARSEAHQIVSEFIAGLEPGQQAVFVMSEVQGMTGPEIAEALGIKLNTVYSRQRLGRQRFAELAARTRAQREGEEQRARRQRSG
jgi:RNA polymerase sigma-70 factor (ECF subfamily)